MANKMQKMTIKANLINLGAIRAQGLKKPIGSFVDDSGSWHTVFVATDRSGEPRFARNGELILNVRKKTQRAG